MQGGRAGCNDATKSTGCRPLLLLYTSSLLLPGQIEAICCRAGASDLARVEGTKKGGTAPHQNVSYEVGYAHALNKQTILRAPRGRELDKNRTTLSPRPGAAPPGHEGILGTRQRRRPHEVGAVSGIFVYE
jgi:hypothetical protein